VLVEVGNALREIRDSRLYRATHGTFEAYCRERWGISRPHAYRLISSAEVAKSLSPVGDITERALRPLAKLHPQKRQAAFSKAKALAGTSPVTPPPPSPRLWPPGPWRASGRAVVVWLQEL
jgi:hypothetical protein